MNRTKNELMLSQMILSLQRDYLTSDHDNNLGLALLGTALIAIIEGDTETANKLLPDLNDLVYDCLKVAAEEKKMIPLVDQAEEVANTIEGIADVINKNRHSSKSATPKRKDDEK